MNARRMFVPALGALAAGSALLILAAGRTWAGAAVHEQVATSFLLVHRSVSGHALSGLGTAAGLLALAGVAAVPATGGLVRAAVGLLLAVAGIAATVEAAWRLAVPPAGLAVTGWPLASLCGGALVAVAGILTLVGGRSWPGMSRRYDAPTRQPARRRDAWEALDHGEDPTAAQL